MCPTLDENKKALTMLPPCPKAQGHWLHQEIKLLQSHTNNPAPAALPQQALEPAQLSYTEAPDGGELIPTQASCNLPLWPMGTQLDGK